MAHLIHGVSCLASASICRDEGSFEPEQIGRGHLFGEKDNMSTKNVHSLRGCWTQSSEADWQQMKTQPLRFRWSPGLRCRTVSCP